MLANDILSSSIAISSLISFNDCFRSVHNYVIIAKTHSICVPALIFKADCSCLCSSIVIFLFAFKDFSLFNCLIFNSKNNSYYDENSFHFT